MKYVCGVCGWEYDEEKGDAELGIAPGTKFEDLPAEFECPVCGVTTEHFEAAEEGVRHERKLYRLQLQEGYILEHSRRTAR